MDVDLNEAGTDEAVGSKLPKNQGSVASKIPGSSIKTHSKDVSIQSLPILATKGRSITTITKYPNVATAGGAPKKQSMVMSPRTSMTGMTMNAGKKTATTKLNY